MRILTRDSRGVTIKCKEIQVDPPKSNEVRIKMIFASLCHTDILHFKGFPIVFLGHEGVGTIESVGEDVRNLKEGDIVMALYVGERKECPNCKSGRTNLCHKYAVDLSGLMLDGMSRMSIHRGEVLYHGFSCSTWSEYTVITSNYAVKIDPQQITLPHASLLCCGFTTGYGATCREFHVEKGSTVAVGLGVLEGAQSQGAGKMIGVNINEFKRGKRRNVTGGLGVDYVFECTGIPSMLNEAIDASRLGMGTIALIGIVNGTSREYNLIPLLCAHEVSFNEINESFELLKDPHCLKVIIKF
ncbi:unnamed protein product [Withania somnifera]